MEHTPIIIAAVVIFAFACIVLVVHAGNRLYAYQVELTELRDLARQREERFAALKHCCSDVAVQYYTHTSLAYLSFPGIGEYAYSKDLAALQEFFGLDWRQRVEKAGEREFIRLTSIAAACEPEASDGDGSPEPDWKALKEGILHEIAANLGVPVEAGGDEGSSISVTVDADADGEGEPSHEQIQALFDSMREQHGDHFVQGLERARLDRIADEEAIASYDGKGRNLLGHRFAAVAKSRRERGDESGELINLPLDPYCYADAELAVPVLPGWRL